MVQHHGIFSNVLDVKMIIGLTLAAKKQFCSFWGNPVNKGDMQGTDTYMHSYACREKTVYDVIYDVLNTDV